MKTAEGGLRQAMEFERFQAVVNRVHVGGESIRCVNRRLYAVPGAEGIFRRVARSSGGLSTTRKGACLVTFDGAIIELVRDEAAEAELREAGFTPPANGQPDRIMVSEQQGQELREAGLRTAEALDQPEGPKAGQSVPAGPGTNNNGLDAQSPLETDDEGLTAAEILEEQRRQATHEQP